MENANADHAKCHGWWASEASLQHRFTWPLGSKGSLADLMFKHLLRTVKNAYTAKSQFVGLLLACKYRSWSSLLPSADAGRPLQKGSG